MCWFVSSLSQIRKSCLNALSDLESSWLKRNSGGFVYYLVKSIICILSCIPLVLKSNTLKAQMHESLSVGILLQTEAFYSFSNKEIQSGSVFNVSNARINIYGSFEDGYFYRTQVNFVRDPILMDAFVGYDFRDGLRFTAGAQKPRQNLDFLVSRSDRLFITQALLTSYLSGSREIGFSLQGDFRDFYYFFGLFNGNGLGRKNDENGKIYLSYRLQWNLNPQILEIAMSGSKGDRFDNYWRDGYILAGETSVFGLDMHGSFQHVFALAEFGYGSLKLKDGDGLSFTESVTSYYVTLGCHLTEKIDVLSRYQTLQLKKRGVERNIVTLGSNYQATKAAAFQGNLDVEYIGNRKKYSVGAEFQLAF